MRYERRIPQSSRRMANASGFQRIRDGQILKRLDFSDPCGIGAIRLTCNEARPAPLLRPHMAADPGLLRSIALSANTSEDKGHPRTDDALMRHRGDPLRRTMLEGHRGQSIGMASAGSWRWRIARNRQRGRSIGTDDVLKRHCRHPGDGFGECGRRRVVASSR